HTMVSMVLFLSLAGACNKKAETPPAPATAPTGSAAMAAPAGSAAAAPTPAPAATDPAPAAPAAAAPAPAAMTIASYDDYKKAGDELMTAMVGAFKADGTDCDKLGGDLDKIITDRKATFDSVKAYEAGHKDDKKKYDNDPASKASQKAFMDAAMPAMQSCKDNAKMKAAFSKLEG
ncbi:MAG TPA: hypothetical protein VGC41_19225, partial [Kofleriaceae bacterium]